MNDDGTRLSKILILDILLVALSVPATAYLVKVSSFLAAFPIFAWGLGLYLDMSSTRNIHGLEPENFDRNELNRIIARLADRFGFTPGAILYVSLWETPVFFSVSLLLFRFVTPFPSLLPDLASRLGGAAAGMCVVHLTAWYSNRRFLENAPSLP